MLSNFYFFRNRRFFKFALENLVDLFICRFQIFFVPYEKWRPDYCVFQCETLRDEPFGYRSVVADVRRSVLCVARWVPWRSKCLDQALAAQRMLNRRGFSTTLYLGMARDESDAWVAHAWVRCGKAWVVGYQSDQTYAVVATYAKMAQ